LTRTVGRQGLRREREILPKPGVSLTVSTLKASEPYRTLRASNEPISFCKVTGLHLSHQKVHIRWNHLFVSRHANVTPWCDLFQIGTFLALFLFRRFRLVSIRCPVDRWRNGWIPSEMDAISAISHPNGHSRIRPVLSSCWNPYCIVLQSIQLVLDGIRNMLTCRKMNTLPALHAFVDPCERCRVRNGRNLPILQWKTNTEFASDSYLV